MNPIKLKTGDYILISTLLLVAVMIYGVDALQPFHDEMPAGEAHAQIQVDGEIYQTVKLTKETQWIEIRTNRGYDVLRVRDYGIEVVESDCPQKSALLSVILRRKMKQLYVYRFACTSPS